MRRRVPVWFRPLVSFCTLTATACGGATIGQGTSGDGGSGEAGTSGDGGSGGACSNAGAAAGMCNALANVGSRVVPTCMPGTVPTGAGGIVADGTYVLSSQTYYNVSTCASEPLSATFAIAGGCVQAVAGADLAFDGGTARFSGTAMISTMGNDMTFDLTCSSLPGGTPDTPVRTFTATGSTLTWFIRNSAAGNTNPDRVEVYTKQ